MIKHTNSFAQNNKEGNVATRDIPRRYNINMCKKKCDKIDDELVGLNIAGVEVDPCIYEEIETIEHCTVHVCRCIKCGHIEIEWEREHKDDE